ncbi:glycosyltransferase [bacterium]|nr:glycosyltransferase [bacterium]
MACRFSVITSTRDPASEELDWHRRLANTGAELVIVENRGRCGLGQAYNEGLARATGEFCCFLHDDARIWSAHWLDRLARAVTVDAFDLVGVAGTTRMPRTGGWWDSGPGFGRGSVVHLHPDGQLLLNDYGPPDDAYRGLSPVVSLDGVLLFGRRQHFESAPFDEDLFDGFHFYDSDLSLRWLLWYGRRLAVVHGIDLIHKAGTNLADWPAMLNRFHYRHGGFLPLGLADVPIWLDNFAALRHQDPGTALRLTAGRRPGSILSFAISADGQVIAKTEQGDLPFLDSRARTPFSNQGNWDLVLGGGTGEIIDHRLRDLARPVVVVEPEAHLVCWLLTRFNWADDIYSGRLRWIVPACDQPTLHELSLHEVVGSLQPRVADLGMPTVFETGSTPFQASFHRAVVGSLSLPLETAKRAAGWPRRSAGDEITIISPQCSIFEDLGNALSQAGCNVRRLDVPDRASLWTRTRYWHVLRTLLESPSPVTLVRNRVFLESIDARQRLGQERLMPGKVVSWWWDEPTVNSYLDWRDPQARRPAFAFARDLLPMLPPGSRWLPPAARTPFLGPVDLSVRPGLPITFVGQSRFSMLRENLNILANILAHHVGPIGPKMGEAINKGRSFAHMHRTLEDHLPVIKGAISRLRTTFPPASIYLDYLLRMSITAAFRLACVESLRSFPIMLFGDEDWVTSGVVDRSQWAGPISPTELPAMYARTKLNLNFNFMQVSSTVNPKVLDIAAVGGAVLTDDRPELVDLFPSPEARPFSFLSLAELPDRVSSLLAKDLDLARQSVRDHVLAHHTMHHRAEWLIRDLSLPVVDARQPKGIDTPLRSALG